MVTFLDRLRQSTFLRHNAIFFVGSIAVGALNYLYYPILGRLLEPAAFGEVQTLVSLFLQLTIFLSVLGLVTINIIANYQSEEKRNQIVFELEKFALVIALFILFATFVAGKQLQELLQFQSQWPFVILAAALVVTVPFTFRTAYLRGVKRFGTTSIASIIGAAGKILLSVILVIAGFGTTGAIAGLVLAQALSWGYSGWQARVNGLQRPVNMQLWSLPKFSMILPELRYSLFVLLGSLGVMVLFSVDVIIVKRFFDAHTAGLYAGVATVARIIFFLTGSISQVLMPLVKIEQPRHQNRQLFIKSILLLAGVSVPMLTICLVAPEFLVSLLMGKNYLIFAELLPLLSVTIFTISILNLVVLYFLALRRYMPAVLAIIGAVAICGLLSLHHATLEGIVTILLYGTMALLCTIAIWVLIDNAKRDASDKTQAHINHYSDP